MDEVVYRHSGLDRAALRGFGTPSDSAGLARLAGHVGALAASAWLIAAASGGWLVLPAMALHGWLLVFLFAPLHESLHRTAFGRRWLNDAVARACGFLLLLPADDFRYFHFAHHRHTQHPANDPELARPKPVSLPAWLLHVSGLPLWASLIGALLRHAVGHADDAYLPPRGRATVIAEARLHLLAYALVAAAALAAGSVAPLAYWLVPALLGQPWLRLFLLAEHTGCAQAADMLTNSRTTLTNPVLRFFAWNMPFHAEHHAFPAVPFHALPALHRRLSDELGVVAPGYVAAQRTIIAGFRRP
jgi:fatty acid desaturase